MILAYEEDKKNKRNKKKREAFEEHLREQGLQLETESKEVKKSFIT